MCKFWSKSKMGCKRNEVCDFLHVTLTVDDVNVKGKVEDIAYKCAGCKHSWTNRTCVVQHVISNHSIYFCLNCDDWIGDKCKVLEKDWSLFDESGNLRHDV